MNNQINNATPNPEPQKAKSILGQYMTLAMQNGLKLGAFFALQALSMLFYNLGAISSLIFVIAFFAIPIYLVILGNKFRDEQLGGEIRYAQAVGFLSWNYLFALIIGAVAYFIVFTLLFNDMAFINMMEESIMNLQEILANTPNGSEMTDAFRGITPKSITVQFIVSALFMGVIYIYIVGIFIKRKIK